jgi:hypothetical protein
MFQRARFMQTESLEARLASEAIRLRKEPEQVGMIQFAIRFCAKPGRPNRLHMSS